jgi:hypothetical protein
VLILFLNSGQSTPGGVKPTCFTDHGPTVSNSKLSDDDFNEVVRIAQAKSNWHRPDVVVGSTQDRAVAKNISSDSTPLVLLCPVWRRWSTPTTAKPNMVFLHFKADEVVPFADSLGLLRNSGLPPSALLAVGTEYRLADEESLKKMVEVVEEMAAHG